jgi:hypothetical protein
VIRPSYLLDEGEQERAEPNRLLLLDPVTGAVDQLDATHPRRRAFVLIRSTAPGAE